MLVKLTKGQKYASNISKPKDRRMHFLWAVWNFKVSFNIVYRMLYSFLPDMIMTYFSWFVKRLDCQAFGLENKAIADGKMTASSERNADHSAKHGRLFSQRAWSAGINDANQWLEVDLSIIRNIVNRVGTQGSGDAQEWVTEYKLLYSYRNSRRRFKVHSK